MYCKRNVISLVYFAICCAGGLNQIETRPKSESKSKSKGAKLVVKDKGHKKANEKFEKHNVEITNLEKMHKLEQKIKEEQHKIKMRQCELLRKEIEYMELEMLTMKINNEKSEENGQELEIRDYSDTKNKSKSKGRMS